MLRPQEAYEQLAALAVDVPWDDGPGGPGASLPVRLRRWVLRQDDDEPADLADDLDALDAREREAVLGELCPALGEALARWWTWAQIGPYQVGWDRRGFRSPRPEDSRRARVSTLKQLLDLGLRWPRDAGWFADWACHVPDHNAVLGGLLASEVTAGRTDVAEALTAALEGRHTISGPSRAGIAALLGCDRPELWERVVDALRGAGRQEGLRATILEAVDLASPDAFARVLDVVVSEDLVRFASTVRAAGVWFGEELTVRTAGDLVPVLAELARAVREPALAGRPGSPAESFARLTGLALRDARRAVPPARALLASSDVALRRAGARVLAELDLDAARDVLRVALTDPDLTVQATALSAWPSSAYHRDRDAWLNDESLAALLQMVRTLGAPTTVETGVIGSRPVEIGAARAADRVLAGWPLTAAPAEALAAATVEGRWSAVNRLAADPPAHRSALFGFFTDPSSSVRASVFAALDQVGAPTAEEARLLHEALRRKSADVRQQAIAMLLLQAPAAVAASVSALIAGNAEQRRAGEELARAAGTASTGQPGSADDGFPAALRFAPVDRTPAIRPALPPDGFFGRYHPGCLRVVTSLRAWLAEHADVEVEVPYEGVQLLANLSWLPPARPGSPLPLAEVVGPWWERTAPSLTDGGVELALLALADPEPRSRWAERAAARVVGSIPSDRRTSRFVGQLVARLAEHEFRPTWTDVALDAAAAVRAELPLSELHGPAETVRRLGGTMRRDAYGQVVGPDAREVFPDPVELLPLAQLTADQLARLWRLARFIDEPAGTSDVRSGPRVAERTTEWDGRVHEEQVPDQPWRQRPSAELLCRALTVGAATRADLLDALLVPEAPADGHHAETALRELSGRRPPEWARTAGIQAVVQEVRSAVVSAETARGDLPGPLSPVARHLRSVTGIPSVVRVLAALGQRPFARGYLWTDDREGSLSHLLRIHAPAPGDTVEELSAALAAAGVPEARVVEFAVYAPQWAGLVEAHLRQPGFESAVWWLHAHTKDESWYVDEQIREEWASAVSRRTPLDPLDLERGAADVAWFRSVIAELGTDRFGRVLTAAKYASSAGGHKRAELFASALLGRLPEEELVERIRGKRHQDSVRALGLLPLEGRHDPALLRRYELLAGFVASDRTSGSQRRASESTAVAVGLENLARSAGYRDPGRLTWAMEADAVRDLAAGPVAARDGDLLVTLSLDPAGAPQLRAERSGRVLKSVPATAAKVPAVAELKARVTTLRQQATRMRRSLEASCVAGERFEVAELTELLGHPVLAPMMRDLVLVSDEGVTGFPADGLRCLLGPGGEQRPVDGSALRIAHPVDLLAGGEWSDLQHEIFLAQRSQPFKQLFRELYLPTAAETTDGPASRRYAGHQVEARRAAGIFASRRWVADFEVGFGRTFHAEKITAWCSLLSGFGTATEVEDATLDEVTFERAGSGEVLPVDEVPPRLFSEVMRDLDLVVSVAHAGGVDPETSESSIEVRRRLVEETAELLGLDNVELTEHHARIRGVLGSYSVQLGSGVVHRSPGGALCIIPVGAQHRGRVFLPFADDDPRTAEVISKVLLLARDDRIGDPSILAQLTRPR